MSLPPCSQQKEAELVTPDSSHLQTFGGLLMESCHQPEILINGELTLNDPMHFREPGGEGGGVSLTYAVTQLVLA
ncbi:hypothetical protein E2320_017951 [Naja naja]|nr:hypothetical protein E2320_017951 [Naja naja]